MYEFIHIARHPHHWPHNLVSDKDMRVQLMVCQHSLSRLYFVQVAKYKIETIHNYQPMIFDRRYSNVG